jgi:hypothetical protein
MIASLLYVTLSSPDILQEIGLVSMFQYALKETHVQAVKRIFRYLKATLDFDLWYSRSKDITLIAYIDAYWVGSIDDKKSINEGGLFLGNCLVSWLRKKKYLISLSTAKVEYIAPIACCAQVLWMKKTLKDIKVEYDQPISILCNKKVQ